MPALPPDLIKYMDLFVVRNGDGHIIWRWGSGGNYELLWIKSNIKGGGRRLLRLMLKHMLSDPPYCTVFGFARECNDKALRFYDRMGFDLSRVDGVYADGVAIVFSANFDDLCTLHGVNNEPDD